MNILEDINLKYFFNPFQANVPFLYHLKTSETRGFHVA